MNNSLVARLAFKLMVSQSHGDDHYQFTPTQLKEIGRKAYFLSKLVMMGVKEAEREGK